MGAYSSWAMLAITHHALVQYAAWRVGHRVWFSWYAVLGDDIVIADDKVANEYVKLMDELGVGIGFHKSIISNNSSLEFAKRFYYKGKIISGLSLGGIAVGWLGPGFISELVSTVQSKLGVKLSLYQVSRFMGVGYKASVAAATRQIQWLPKILRSAVLLLSRPGAPLGVASFLEWFLLGSLTGVKGKIMLGGEEVIFDSLWRDIRFKLFPKTLDRSSAVLNGFFGYDKKSKKGKTTRKSYECHFDTIFGRVPHTYTEWFYSVLISTFRKRYDAALDQAREIIEKARREFYKTYDLGQVVALLEKATALLALVPTEVGLHRREPTETPLSKELNVALSPRSVKRWKSVFGMIDRKSKPKFKPYIAWDPKTFR
jgi:hypothetical protein